MTLPAGDPIFGRASVKSDLLIEKERQANNRERLIAAVGSIECATHCSGSPRQIKSEDFILTGSLDELYQIEDLIIEDIQKTTEASGIYAIPLWEMEAVTKIAKRIKFLERSAFLKKTGNRAVGNVISIISMFGVPSEFVNRGIFRDEELGNPESPFFNNHKEIDLFIEERKKDGIPLGLGDTTSFDKGIRRYLYTWHMVNNNQDFTDTFADQIEAEINAVLETQDMGGRPRPKDLSFNGKFGPKEYAKVIHTINQVNAFANLKEKEFDVLSAPKSVNQENIIFTTDAARGVKEILLRAVDQFVEKAGAETFINSEGKEVNFIEDTEEDVKAIKASATISGLVLIDPIILGLPIRSVGKGLKLLASGVTRVVNKAKISLSILREARLAKVMGEAVSVIDSITKRMKVGLELSADEISSLDRAIRFMEEDIISPLKLAGKEFEIEKAKDTLDGMRKILLQAELDARIVTPKVPSIIEEAAGRVPVSGETLISDGSIASLSDVDRVQAGLFKGQATELFFAGDRIKEGRKLGEELRDLAAKRIKGTLGFTDVIEGGFRKVAEFLDAFHERRRELLISKEEAVRQAQKIADISNGILPDRLIDNPLQRRLYRQHINDLDEAITAITGGTVPRNVNLADKSVQQLIEMKKVVTGQMMSPDGPAAIQNVVRQAEQGFDAPASLISQRNKLKKRFENDVRVFEAKLAGEGVSRADKIRLQRDIQASKRGIGQLDSEIKDIKAGKIIGDRKNFSVPKKRSEEVIELDDSINALEDQIKVRKVDLASASTDLSSAGEAGNVGIMSSSRKSMRKISDDLDILNKRLSIVKSRKKVLVSKAESLIEITPSARMGRKISEFVTPEMKTEFLRFDEESQKVLDDFKDAEIAFENETGPVLNMLKIVVPRRMTSVRRGEIFDLVNQNSKFEAATDAALNRVITVGENGNIESITYGVDPWVSLGITGRLRRPQMITSKRLEKTLDRILGKLNDEQRILVNAFIADSGTGRANFMRGLLFRKITDNVVAVGADAPRAVLQGFLPQGIIPFVTDGEEMSLLIRQGTRPDYIRKGQDVSEIRKSFSTMPYDQMIQTTGHRLAPEAARTVRIKSVNSAKKQIKRVNKEVIPELEKALEKTDVIEQKIAIDATISRAKQHTLALSRIVDDPKILDIRNPNMVTRFLSNTLSSFTYFAGKATKAIKTSKTVLNPLRYYVLNGLEGAEFSALSRGPNFLRNALMRGNITQSRVSGNDISKTFGGLSMNQYERLGMAAEKGRWNKMLNVLAEPANEIDEFWRVRIGGQAYEDDFADSLKLFGKNADGLSEAEKIVAETKAIRVGRDAQNFVMINYEAASGFDRVATNLVPFWFYQSRNLKRMAVIAKDNPIVSRFLASGMHYDALTIEDEALKKRARDGKLNFVMNNDNGDPTGLELNIGFVFASPQALFGDQFSKGTWNDKSFLLTEMDNISGHFGLWWNPLVTEPLKVMSGDGTSTSKVIETIDNVLENINIFPAISIKNINNFTGTSVGQMFARATGVPEDQIQDYKSARRRNWARGRAARELGIDDNVDRGNRLSDDEIEEFRRDADGRIEKRMVDKFLKDWAFHSSGLTGSKFKDRIELQADKFFEKYYAGSVPGFRTTKEDVERWTKILGNPDLAKTIAMLVTSSTKDPKQRARQREIKKDLPFLGDSWLFGLDDQAFDHAMRMRRTRTKFFKERNPYKKKMILEMNPEFALFQKLTGDIFDEEETISIFDTGDIKKDLKGFQKADARQRSNLFLANPQRFDLLKSLNSGERDGPILPFAAEAGIDPETGGALETPSDLEPATNEATQASPDFKANVEEAVNTEASGLPPSGAALPEPPIKLTPMETVIEQQRGTIPKEEEGPGPEAEAELDQEFQLLKEEDAVFNQGPPAAEPVPTGSVGEI